MLIISVRKNENNRRNIKVWYHGCCDEDEVIVKCHQDSKKYWQLMSDIMEIIDERERQKNKDRKKQTSDANYSESVRGKWFCCTFKLGFVQLICKVSLIFKSNL